MEGQQSCGSYTGCEGVDWILLAKDRVQQLDNANTAKNLPVP